MKNILFILALLFFTSCSNDDDCLRAKMNYIENYLEELKHIDNNVEQNRIRQLQYEAGLAKFDC